MLKRPPAVGKKTGCEARLGVREGLQPRAGETGPRQRQGSREKGRGQMCVGEGTVLCWYVPLAEQDTDSLLLGCDYGQNRIFFKGKKLS